MLETELETVVVLDELGDISDHMLKHPRNRMLGWKGIIISGTSMGPRPPPAPGPSQLNPLASSLVPSPGPCQPVSGAHSTLSRAIVTPLVRDPLPSPSPSASPHSGPPVDGSNLAPSPALTTPVRPTFPNSRVSCPLNDSPSSSASSTLPPRGYRDVNELHGRHPLPSAL